MSMKERHMQSTPEREDEPLCPGCASDFFRPLLRNGASAGVSIWWCEACGTVAAYLEPMAQVTYETRPKVLRIPAAQIPKCVEMQQIDNRNVALDAHQSGLLAQIAVMVSQYSRGGDIPEFDDDQEPPAH